MTDKQQLIILNWILKAIDFINPKKISPKTNRLQDLVKNEILKLEIKQRDQEHQGLLP